MEETKGIWDADFKYVALSDIGMRRTNNQDSLSVSLASDQDEWNRRGHLFMVADGMGAHAAGELASEMAADTVPHLYQKYADVSPPEALKRAVVETNAEINRKGQANEEFHNMGTTASVLALLPQGAIVAQVGDSRVYRMRKNRLEQLTFDHSLVWEMRAAGQLSEKSELANLVPKNVITRSLGPYPDVKVDIEGPFPIEPGDVFLLCSDGLTGQLNDDELGPLLSSLAPDEAAQLLIDLANLRGGPDNITVIVIKVIGGSAITSAAGASPLKIGKKSKSGSVHPVAWASLVACVIAAILMGLLSQTIPALIAGLGALGALGHVIYKMVGSTGSQQVVSAGKRFGKGPYTQTDCVAGQGLVKKLQVIMDDLHTAAQENNWTVDWEKVQEFCSKAEKAAEKSDSIKAIRYYARGISSLMRQLRSQQNGS